jgi:hypothetical protein
MGMMAGVAVGWALKEKMSGAESPDPEGER